MLSFSLPNLSIFFNIPQTKTTNAKDLIFMTYLFSSEAVSEGHPDKICDAISDTIVDLFLSKDVKSRTAIETLATTNQVIIAGETSSSFPISHDEIEHAVRQTIKSIGYDQEGFSYADVNIQSYLHKQSSDIALGVDRFGAGDQGIMFGYAKKEGSIDTNHMPLAIYLANKILHNLSLARHQNKIKGILPDAKSQVTIEYDNNNIPIGVKKVVLSTQHTEQMSQDEVRQIACHYIREALPQGWQIHETDILINPTGRFVIGGPDGDTGLTGRKIVVDTYGGYAPHGGGAFSGKDPTKVDRSAAYMLRHIAKNIVAAGIADECTIQTSYAIGVADPLSFYINTHNTCQVDETKLLKIVKEMFDLTPLGIIKHLKLQNPIYTPTAAYGHFGRTPNKKGFFTWEETNLAKELKKCF